MQENIKGKVIPIEDVPYFKIIYRYLIHRKIIKINCTKSDVNC